MSEGLNAKQRQIVEEARAAHARDEDARTALARISDRHGVTPELVARLLWFDEQLRLIEAGTPLYTDEAGEPVLKPPPV